MLKPATFVSVIVPVYNEEKNIEACLKAIFRSKHPHYEVVVVDDHSTDASARLASQFPCHLFCLTQNMGAAAARNRGAAAARGDILFFLDADILIEPDTLTQIIGTFQHQPHLSALFCSYQKDTVPTDFFSQYKNLVHHYTHQISQPEAATFCSGYGAIKRDVFQSIGGFNEQQKFLEDIELGYRLHQVGHRIYLNKDIQLTHCKEYSFLRLVKSDVLGRAIPWTQLMLKNKIFRNDLNTRNNNIFSVIVIFLMLLCLPLLFIHLVTAYILAGLFMAFLGLNYNFFQFVYRDKGIRFTLKTILMSGFTYLYSGVGLLLGLLIFLSMALFSTGPYLPVEQAVDRDPI